MVEDVFDCIPSKQQRFELMAPENETSPSDSKAEYGKLCNMNHQCQELLCQVEGGRVDEKRVLHNQHGRDAFRLCWWQRRWEILLRSRVSSSTWFHECSESFFFLSVAQLRERAEEIQSIFASSHMACLKESPGHFFIASSCDTQGRDGCYSSLLEQGVEKAVVWSSEGSHQQYKQLHRW